MSQRQEENGVLTWVLIGAICFGVIGAMVWITGSHFIVFHTLPIFKAIGSIWRLFPDAIGATPYADLNALYPAYRFTANKVSFGDWLSYANLALQPYSYLFAIVAVGLFFRQIKSLKAKRVNDRLSPTELAHHMMGVFSEIAPVVAIQEKLVANKLSKWARQVFPEEFIKKAKYQGKTVLVPDPEAERTDGDRGLMLDEVRFNGFLTETKVYTHNGMQLLRSYYLGRQIVDLVKDGKALKQGKKVMFADRFSDVGKAVFAILAPYAFGAKAGREQSRKVIDALNRSAYGTPQGEANLAVPEVTASFEQWRNHPMVARLARIHHWEHTYLFVLLVQARRSGKIGTWSFVWLKPMDRIMFYVLNTCGRKTPHSEAGLAFSQVQFEQLAAKNGYAPIRKDGRPSIFTRKVIKAFEEEWQAWRNGDEDNENWWQDESLLTPDDNSALLAALSDMNSAPPVPATAN